MRVLGQMMMAQQALAHVQSPGELATTLSDQHLKFLQEVPTSSIHTLTTEVRIGFWILQASILQGHPDPCTTVLIGCVSLW